MRGCRSASPSGTVTSTSAAGRRARRAADYDGPEARFGAGSIDTEAACRAAGGYWVPLAFGWMTHVYPNESDPERIWLGEHAMHLPRPEGASPAGHAGHAHPH